MGEIHIPRVMAVLEDQVVAVELILEIELVDRVVEVFRQLVIMPPVEALMEEKHSPVIPLVAMVVAMVMVAMAVAVVAQLTVAMAVAVAVIPVVVVLVIKILVVDRAVVLIDRGGGAAASLGAAGIVLRSVLQLTDVVGWLLAAGRISDSEAARVYEFLGV